MPQGRSMAKDLSFMPLSAQARPAVEFHWSKFQHFVWLWIWSKRQCSGTRRASDWKGPSVIVSSVSTEREQGGRYWSALLVDEDDVRVCIVADIERLGGWTLNSELNLNKLLYTAQWGVWRWSSTGECLATNVLLRWFLFSVIKLKSNKCIVWRRRAEKRSETLNQVNLVIYKNVCKKTCKCNKDKKLEEKLITVLATSNLSISKMFNPHLTAKFSIFDVKYIISLLGLKAFVF